MATTEIALPGGFESGVFADLLRKLVVDSVTSPESKRSYGRAVDMFVNWFQVEQPVVGFTKATVQAYKSVLVGKGLSPATVNLYLAAIKKLAVEAADNGYLSQEIAGSILRVKGAKKLGDRTGNWLQRKQAEKLIKSPDVDRLKGKRDRAILAVMIGAGLRRSEVTSLRVEHIQQREGRWVLIDIIGKGGRVRSVPMPGFAKAAIDVWLEDAGIRSGNVFRSVNRGGHVNGGSMSPQAVFAVVQAYAEKLDVKLSAHDLRRCFAKLAHKGASPIEQIQISLGHSSIQTTERYLGVNQDLIDAPCDHLGLKIVVGR